MFGNKMLFRALLLWSGSAAAYASLRGSNTSNNPDSRSLQAGVYSIVVPDTDATDPLLDLLSIPSNAAEIGVWSDLKYHPVVSVHSAVMPNGKVLTYGSSLNTKNQDARTMAFWDPRQGYGGNSLNVVPNPVDVDSFCSSGNWLSNGQFLASGGAVAAGTSLESLLLNYSTETSVRGADLKEPRWYGTMTKLGDGRVVMTGGTDFKNVRTGQPSPTPEVFSLNGGWELLNGATSVELFADNDRWWYPHQWLSPSGTVFGISIDKMWEMNVEGDGSIKTLGNFKTLPNANTKPNVGGSATAVMFDAGKILQIGGNGNTEGNPSSDQASVFDISNISSGSVQVTDTSPMNEPRRYADANVLPDGTVLVNGGSKNSNNDGADAVLHCEIWNPKTGQWTLGPPSAVYRGYHSSTVLLPNGAVFTSGGGIPGPVTHLNQQIYFPPYLFKKSGETSVRSERPRIVSMSSDSLNYQDILRLEINNDHSAVVREVSFIALPAVTHSFDSNQRRLTLDFTQSTVGIDVVIPSSRNLAPPGYYYLTVVDTGGVPSTSVIVALESAAPVAPPEVDNLIIEATNELINGSFESNTMTSTSFEIVDASTIAGWKSENGEPMELWKNGFNGISAPDGIFFLELDANAGFPDAIFQDLNTKADTIYTISFNVRSRSVDVDSESEKVYVKWCGKEVNQNGYNAAKSGEWSTINISVTGTGSVCRLMFHESYADGANNGVGVLLDNVAFVETSDLIIEATNELINGSFESNTMTSTSFEIVDASTIAGWKSENGEPMELWKNGFNDISAPDGIFFLELDANAGFPDAIFQDLNTKADTIYTISFNVRSRSADVDSESEKVYVQWCGKEVNQNGYYAAKSGEWSTINISVTGTGSVCRLMFHESYADGANNGLGVLLDNVAFIETSADLIVNGSFEENSIPAGQWKLIPSSQVKGWFSMSNQPLEIWGSGLLGFDSVDGSNILELDAAKGLDSIYQDIGTQSGQTYQLTFFLRARTSGAETVTVTWSGATIGTYTAQAEWSKIEAKVVGSGGNDRLVFQESSSENDGYGVLLDNISLI